MSVGKVWLVGAGPGDAGLLTLRGREVLLDADSVVFDRLVGDGVLAMIPKTARALDVGKEGGCHPVPQSEIEKLLVQEAQAGRKVVRLKGGDPFVFGRGGEEAETLLKHGIPFEVVPGISSAFAAAAAAGVPVTHRGLAAAVHVITAHTRKGAIAELDYASLAKIGGTLVFLMGASSVPEICSALLAGGMDGAVPAAAVENGSTARQRRIDSTLGRLEKDCLENGLKSPAVIIVGAVAALGPSFDWKKQLPLAGLKVVVTRPRGRAGSLSRMLRDRGAEVVELPSIATRTLDVQLPPFDGCGWVCFTSVTGVESFFELLNREEKDVRSLGAAKIAAVGPATAKALEARGLRVDYVPEVYDGLHLAEGLLKLAAGSKILLLRAREVSPELGAKLKAGGADFREFALYETTGEKPVITPRDLDAAVFTSASTVRGFKAAFPELPVKYACCIGRQTADEAAKAGFADIRVAAKATLEDLIKAVEETNKL